MNLQCEVHSQKAGLVVDTRQRTIRGWTELQLTPGKDSHKLGLHALGLSIHSVTVNGRQAEFKHKPHQTWEELPDSVLTAQHASPDKMLAAVGEAAYYQYERALQREKELELVITHAGDESSPLTPSQRPAPELDPAPGNPTLIEGGEPPAAPAAPDSLPFPTPPANPAGGTIAVRVEYSAVRPACGVHFSGRYAATCNQVRRASAWLPCLDVPNGKVEFSLQLTVREDEVAVASGNLLKRTASHQLPGWHTYHYSTPLPCPPCQLMFAVGPFAVLPSPPSAGRPSSALITHFCPPADVHPPSIPPSPLVSGDLHLPGATPSGGPPASGGGKGGDRDPPLLATAKFFLLPMSLYETLLGQRFPLPSMQQVFVPGEVLPEGVQVGVGVQVLPSHLLLNLRSIEQSLEARLVIAGALARQWFGVYMRPAAPADDWLVEGLAGWLEEQYIKKYMGNNELQYRRWRQREAIVAADTGDAPPLSWRGPSTPSPWGALYGTHALDPSNLRKLKATAVIGMLERRAGDMFKKHLERVLSAACHPEPSASGNPRLLDTTAFLTDLGKAASFRKEIPAFAERWIYRRGVPSITAGFLYHRRKSVLELAIRQSGSEAAKEAADVAERVAQREGTGAGVIKVVVRESEVTTEHPVHLGGHAAVLQELKVNPEVKKPAGRRGMRKKKGEGEEGDVADGDALLGEAGPASAALVDQHPVQWVRIDPGGEWLCSCRMVQPERCWLAQLQHSKDVVAQAEAVQGLVDLSQGSSGARPSVLAALVRVLDSSTVYFRVRQDAALALAALRDGEGGCAGLEPLLSWYKSRHWDTAADPPCPRPTPVTDPSEYLVAQAVVAAIACCKDGDGLTHMDALLFLMEELDSYQSRVGGYDDSGLVAAMCEALGTITTDPELAESYLTMLEGELMRDVVAPSPSSCVGRACLGAMVQLATGASGSAELRASASDTLRRCLATASLPAPLRREAHAAAVQLLSAAGGAEAALRYAVHAAGAHALVASRTAKGAEGEAVATARPESAGAGELFFQLPLTRARSGLSEGLDPATVAGIWEEVVGAAGGNHGILSLATLRRTAALLNAAHHCRLRHLAFMALRRLQRLPPTLYQPASPDEEDFLTGGAVPAISHGATRRTGAVPAPSGAAPAPTHDSKGAATTRTKRVTIRLPIKAGGGRGALSGEDGGGVEESAGGVTMSDGRVAGAMASPSVSEVAQPLPLEAMGTQFSPVRPPDDVAGGEEEEVGTQLKPPAPTAPLQTGAHPALRPAGTAAEAPAVSPGPPSGPVRSLKLKIRAPSSGPPAPAAAPAAPAGSAEVAVPRQQGGMVGGSTPPSREASPGLAPGKPHAGGGSLGQGPGRKLPGSRKTSPAPPPGAARERSREPSPLAVPSAGKGGRASREPSPAPRPPSLPGAAQQRKQQGASPGISGDQGAVGGVGKPGKRTPSRQATPTGVEEYPKPGGRGGATRPKQAKREKTPQPAADEGPKPELGDVLAAFMQAGEAAARSKGGKKRRPPSASPEQPGSGSATTAGAAGGQRCGKRPRATPPPSASPPPPAAPSRPPSAGGGTAPGEPAQRKASLIASTMPRVVIKGKKQMQQQPSWAQRAVAQEPSEPRGGQPANQTAHPPQHAQGGPPQVPSSGAAGAGFGGGSAAASQQTQPAAPGAAKPAFKIKLKVKPLAKPP